MIIFKDILKSFFRSPKQIIEDHINEVGHAMEQLERTRRLHLELADTYARGLEHLRLLTGTLTRPARHDRTLSDNLHRPSAWPDLDEHKRVTQAFASSTTPMGLQ